MDDATRVAAAIALVAAVGALALLPRRSGAKVDAPQVVVEPAATETAAVRG
jgi:hypothetical protein